MLLWAKTTKNQKNINTMKHVKMLAIGLIMAGMACAIFVSCDRDDENVIISEKETLSIKQTATNSSKKMLRGYQTRSSSTYSINIDQCPAHIAWPFGADGSSWNNRKGWKGGDETGCGSEGYGPRQGTHRYYGKRADDTFAVDWNQCGGKDYGKEFRSPLDGKVINVRHGKKGYGNYVDIQQINQMGEKVVFRIAHLKSIAVHVGQQVKAGKTKIGNIGKSGNVTGPHAHCALYLIQSDGSYKGMAFKFDA